MGAAGDRWARELAGWQVPEDILAQAPESPWGFLPGMFDATGEEQRDTPSQRLALDALEGGGVVVDVGCGGGISSLGLAPPATELIGVDERADAVSGYAEAAAAHGVASRTFAGSWTDIAAEVPAGDVVVCHHVLYNVPAVVAFVDQLTAHARRLVVVEMHDAHPLVHLRPLWQRFWGIDRPRGPTARDAIEVVRELGIEPRVDVGERPSGHWRSPEQQVHLARKRLCLPASRDAEVAAALEELPPASQAVWTLSWPGTAPSIATSA
jgi:SAM-dependent methyltransferase